MNAQSFAGRADFQRLVAELVAWAAEQRVREIRAWDATFAEWPWSQPSVLDSLGRWVGPGRQLHLLALQYDDVQRVHPRFVRWRRDFAHCVTARAVDPELRLESVPEALLLLSSADLSLSLRLFDHHFWRGELSIDRAAWVRHGETYDALVQRSSDSFAPTTLGL
ncbi:hypothetical protein [Roseateles sp. BYS87W]|uniref:Uncharacterized protein n=1 Tax=Pelomonas baiyunensis TaxID=3299026 RepID=A0ABW7GWW6_9BURK